MTGGLSEQAQLLLGAFALADSHTLTAPEVVAMAGGAFSAADAEVAFDALCQAALAEALAPSPGEDQSVAYRLTKAGLEKTLELQEALARRRSS